MQAEAGVAALLQRIEQQRAVLLGADHGIGVQQARGVQPVAAGQLRAVDALAVQEVEQPDDVAGIGVDRGPPGSGL
ncbi:hypothetical protein D3C78_1561000 [compost metagenome]